MINVIKFLEDITLGTGGRNIRKELYIEFHAGETYNGKLINCFKTYCDIIYDDELVYGVPREVIQNLGPAV